MQGEIKTKETSKKVNVISLIEDQKIMIGK